MKTLTKIQLAKQLNNRCYGEEITKEEEKLAKENNLVVIFGASDDLVELRGAIEEEFGLGYRILITKDGLLENDCENENCPHFHGLLNAGLRIKSVFEIKAHWCGEGLEPSFYESIEKPNFCFTCEALTELTTFDILEDNGDYYCRGIILDLDELFLE
jgi:hypothetical protein